MFDLQKETEALEYIFNNIAGVITYQTKETDISSGGDSVFGPKKHKEKKLKSIVYTIGVVGGFLDTEALKKGRWRITKASYDINKGGYWSYFISKVIHEADLSVFPLALDYSYEQLKEIRNFKTEILKKLKNSLIEVETKKRVWEGHPEEKAFFDVDINLYNNYQESN